MIDKIMEKMRKEDRLLKESAVVKAVQKELIKMGYEPFEEKVMGIYTAIDNVPQVCTMEEFEVLKDDWIACSERLPENNDSVLCWAKSTARGGDVCFVGSCHNGFWFLQSSANTHSFPGQYVIIAWKPIAPYQPKEDK